jgi:predicted transcriptional regulator
MNPNDSIEYNILKFIDKDPLLSQRKLAHFLGLSLGTIHSKMVLLIEKGYVDQIDLSSGSKKKKYRYEITKKGRKYFLVLMNRLKSHYKSELNSLKKLHGRL